MNNFVRVAHPMPKSKIPVSQMTPEQAAAYKGAQAESKQKSEEWLAQNPRHADNIVAHWDQSTPEHKDQGMSWYPDAHHAANVIARDSGITTNQAAGLIANYSPQQHWAQNLRMASLAAKGQIIGGPKTDPTQEGFMASASQAEAAKRILGGEDYHDIFRGKKIKSFGHLIEHGGDTDPDDPKVVVDRHALGVAHGGFADDGVYNHSKVSAGVRKDGSSPVYDEVSNMYKDAADQINARDGGHNGVPIEPHQLQAATWLTRQRLNAEGGYTGGEDTGKGGTQAKIAEGYTNKWNEYAAQNHPELVNKVPGTGFSKAVGQGGMSNPEQFSTTLPGKAAYKLSNDWKPYPAGGNNAMTMTHPSGFGSAMVVPHSQGGYSAYHTDITDPSNPVDAGRFLTHAEAQQAAAHGLMKNNVNPTEMHPMNFQPNHNYSLSSIARTAKVSNKWEYDALSDQFKTSNLEAKFSCNCGKQFTPEGFHKCACGQTWASFDIIPQEKLAGKIIRIVRPVKDHNRILAKTSAQIQSENLLKYLRSLPDLKKFSDVEDNNPTGGEITDVSGPNKVDADDDEAYRDADSQHQQGDRQNSIKVPNEFTQGIEPNSSVPFYIRQDRSQDLEPVVFDKSASFLPVFVRSARM